MFCPFYPPCTALPPIAPCSLNDSVGSINKQTKKQLTFSAVLSLPARVAYDFSALAAGKVSEGIISGSTEDRAAVTVVVLVTQEAVGVTQLCPASRLHVLGPFFSHSQVTLSGDPTDQTLWIVWKSQGRSLL